MAEHNRLGASGEKGRVRVFAGKGIYHSGDELA